MVPNISMLFMLPIFVLEMLSSDRNICEIISEYKIDYGMNFFNVNMFLTYRQILILCISALLLLAFIVKSGKLL